MNQDYLLLLPVFFPLAAGLITFCLARTSLGKKEKHIFIFAALLLEFVFTVICLTRLDARLTLWQLTDTMQVAFHVDVISVIFAGLAVTIWMLVGTFAFVYMSHEENEERFFGFYLIVETALVALAFADNLITYYVFFELMTFTSLPLVLHEMTERAIMAGLKYLFYSVAGAFMALFGIFFLSMFGGIGSFAAGGILDQTAVMSRHGLLLAAVFLMILGFGTKAGMFPMHGWLPTAHPEAPAPASAVLSGVITKMGVLGLIRVIFYVVGPDLIRGTWVQTAWLTLTLITVFLGSMMAYKEKVMKKRLAYSTVSQVSYILFGLALLNKTAFIGAIAHVIFHSLVKNTLFLTAGAIIFKTGNTKVEDMRGIGKEMPVAIWCYTFVSLTLVGIPPTSGFVSKWYLATGSLASGTGAFTWVGPVILLISALLTAGYLLPLTINGFFPGADYDYTKLQNKEPNLLMLVPMIIMTIGAVLLGMFPGVITGAAASAASMIF